MESTHGCTLYYFPHDERGYSATDNMVVDLSKLPRHASPASALAALLGRDDIRESADEVRSFVEMERDDPALMESTGPASWSYRRWFWACDWAHGKWWRPFVTDAPQKPA